MSTKIVEFDLPLLETAATHAFTRCDSVTSMCFPSLISAEDHSFFICSILKEFTANKLQTLGHYAFADCD